MAKKVRVEVDTKPLNKLLKTLTEFNGMRVKVGILSSKNSREGGFETNAAIGSVHEFGSYSRNIPQRSFIKLPLMMKMDEIVKEVSRLMQASLDNGDPMPVLKQAGVVAEGAIGEGFESGGFGTWQPITARTAFRKNSEAILIDSSQLQRSITSAVVKGG